MMLVTTLAVACLIVGAIYFFAVRFIPWPGLSYALMLGVGVACLIPGDVHFRYVGIEVAALGSLMVWAHHHFIRKPSAKSANGEA